MDKKTIMTMKKTFDDIMHTTEDGSVEFWYARELMECLGYATWRRFKEAIERAKESCESAEIEVSDHFAGAGKMVEIGSGAMREKEDMMLTRYACYLIAQNGDPRKEEIAFAQSYFAVQTRKQELIEERIAYIERTEARGKLRESEKRLSQNIYERGVDDAGFGRIRLRGDQALFGGKSTQDMKKKLGVSDKRPLADFLPTLTIAAKNLATEMTNYNVEEKDLQGEGAITTEHVQNNLSVREMLGTRGIKPEELPPSEDIKKLERRAKSQEKKLAKESGKNVDGRPQFKEMLEMIEIGTDDIDYVLVFKIPDSVETPPMFLVLFRKCKLSDAEKKEFWEPLWKALSFTWSASKMASF